ncbi:MULTISPECIES: hypothetical protein [Dehalococcoides]|jgi:hypothetical protein|uniref:Uncharacterized protein n=1 Tax=Dehalococcoides mccartyi TaxID=61435 RepID=A0A1S7AUA5_9CHLR|nr:MULTISPECIES: hypothetical protein [Dehalococcoides]AGG06693.1 putative membrane protein [Dehalococcoides mccartyi DCMB5]AGG08188.1 putative membrane protein [Dehalococcoides mccartyi BTF08]AQU06228.1 hypothetical protein B1777_05975 [Dehalococcoides mccartyi]AQU07671.1 hypothetical protein B1778_05775 [Dehalococcoides mccartyi]AQW62701.1 hypothetical protein B1779_05385 [Dehalococcoides mccartyi]
MTKNFNASTPDIDCKVKLRFFYNTIQIVLGVLIILCSLVAINQARWTELPVHEPTYGPDGIPSIITDAPPPNSPLEYFLTAAGGLLVTGLGIIQALSKESLSKWYIALGIITIVLSLIMSQVITDNPRITGNIFIIPYLILVLGGANSTIAARQLYYYTKTLTE